MRYFDLQEEIGEFQMRKGIPRVWGLKHPVCLASRVVLPGIERERDRVSRVGVHPNELPILSLKRERFSFGLERECRTYSRYQHCR